MDGDVKALATEREAIESATYHLDLAQKAAGQLPHTPQVAKLRTAILLAALQLTNC